MKYWRINTDSEGEKNPMTCDLWYMFHMAFAGDYKKNPGDHSTIFKKLEAGDGIFMHHTGLGVVGYGEVITTWDGKYHKGNAKKVYKNNARAEFYEYRIEVDWKEEYDCRKNPLSIRYRLPYRGIYSHIDTEKWDVQSVLRDLTIRNQAHKE
jgi:hypothetical protein